MTTSQRCPRAQDQFESAFVVRQIFFQFLVLALQLRSVLPNSSPVVSALFGEPDQRDFVSKKLNQIQKAFIQREVSLPALHSRPMSFINAECVIDLFVFQARYFLREVYRAKQRGPPHNRRD